jgi:hypothetical protein
VNSRLQEEDPVVNINAVAESFPAAGSIQHIEEFVTVMSPTPPFLNTKTAKNTKRKLI